MTLTNQNENIRNAEKYPDQKMAASIDSCVSMGARPATEFESLAYQAEELSRKNYEAVKQDLLRAGSCMLEAGKKHLDPNEHELLKQLMLKVYTRSL